MQSLEKVNLGIQELVMNQPTINGIALMSKEGLIIQSALDDSNEDFVAAAGAILYHLGTSTLECLQKGSTDMVFVKGVNGYIIVSAVSRDIIMLVSTSTSEIQIGTLMFEVKEAIKKFGDLNLNF